MSTGAAGILAGPAAIADGAGNFPIDTIEVDPPAAGEVRVAMAAAGVCHTDHASLHWPGPLVPGHEGAGHVESVGTGMRGLVPGQPVLLNWAIPCGDCFQCARGAQALCERTHELDVARLGSSRAGEAFEDMLAGRSAKGVLRIGEGSGGSDGSRDFSPRPGPVATSRWRHAATTPTKAQEPAA